MKCFDVYCWVEGCLEVMELAKTNMKRNYESDEISHDKEEISICGNCQWVRRPKKWNLNLLYRAMEEGFLQLILVANYFKRQKYWCKREKCWTHLLDPGCSLWQRKIDANENGKDENV